MYLAPRPRALVIIRTGLANSQRSAPRFQHIHIALRSHRICMQSFGHRVLVGRLGNHGTGKRMYHGPGSLFRRSTMIPTYQCIATINQHVSMVKASHLSINNVYGSQNCFFSTPSCYSITTAAMRWCAHEVISRRYSTFQSGFSLSYNY